MRVANKVAIVTGGGSGIGRASAMALAREGAQVAVADYRAEAGEDTVRLILKAGGKAIFVQADVAQSADVETMVASCAEHFGAVEILHNNAGIALRQPVADQDEEGWNRCLRANLNGVYLCCKYAIPHMKERGGSIINMSSVTGIVGVRNRAVYSASKGAIVALTRNMALDYAPHRIRVNCICPGFTRTPMIERLLQDPEAARKLTALHPLGRLGIPEDIANAVLFLASDESSWMTGQTLVIDGGFAAGRPEDI